MAVAQITLPVLLLLFTCGVYLIKSPPLPAKHPVVLVFASAILVFSLQNARVRFLQKIIAVYLFSLLGNWVGFIHLEMNFGNNTLAISYGVIVFLVCMAGILTSGLDVYRFSHPLFKNWGVVVLILVLHAGFLFGLIKHYYGYGYEEIPHSLGQVGFFFMLFFFLWDRFERGVLLRMCGVLLGLFFLLLCFLKN
jgi:hypothetical protein